MPRTTHHQRIARGLAKATHLTYQQALEKVAAAAAAGLLPSPLDKAGVARAVDLLASRTVEEYASTPAVSGAVALNSVFDQPHGIVLVTGLIGTGKTTLMYETALRLAAQGCEVVTFEDPIERTLTSEPGRGSIRQIECQPQAGWLGDPDVVIINELRRRDDIEAAVHLAYTGHLVIAGLYSHSAEEALHRVVGTYPMPEQQDARHSLADTLIAVVEMSRENGQHQARTLIIDETMRTSIRTGPTPADPDAEARLANIRAGNPPLGHEFWGVAGHPDDDECTHREDGTDATYCGLTADEHGYLGDEWDLLTEVLDASTSPRHDEEY